MPDPIFPFIDIAIDSKGNIFVAGVTTSGEFPVVTAGYDTTYNGGDDVFVVKYDSELKHLLAATFIGGKSNDWSRAIYIDGQDNIYITGKSWSRDFAGGIDKAFVNELVQDIGFIVQLDSSLSMIKSIAYIDNADIFAIAPGHDGTLYVAGGITSDPQAEVRALTAGFDRKYHGGMSDGFVARYGVTGLDQLMNFTLIGSSGVDEIIDIKVNDQNFVYLVGYAGASDFPTTSDAFDNTYNGGFTDAFVVKLDGELSTLVASTFLGGQNIDRGHSLGIDDHDQIVVTGATESADFPCSEVSFDNSFNGGENDMFLTVLSGDLDKIIASTFVGGSARDRGIDLVITQDNHIVVAGETSSSNFPVIGDSRTNKYSGGQTDMFLVLFDISLNYLGGSILGGKQEDLMPQLALINKDVLVVGSTASNDFPSKRTMKAVDYSQRMFDLFVSQISFK
ncbi:MAG: SBBP repeat-containing protein [Proteobacteria bacterium]|nr:SBBP repeat-containing protein [Pseudomonadota bacterium]